ncbi:TlpA disulfide reductase family protein [Algibacter aquimarinus]|uniref:Thioredoxin domain-containing protein n=1 Tax=Algibacter aquimarinus TaxID=1136748 RepID=A0ABP9HEI9_9FLAO
MKKLLILALIITISACKEEPKVDYTVVTGKITNKASGDFSIQSFDRTFEKTLEVSEDGTFADTLTVDGNSYVLYDGKNPIFMHLESGYNLNVTYDATDFDNTLTITGKGSEINNYLLSKRKNQKELFGNSKDTYSLDEAEYKEKMGSIKDTQLALLESVKGIPGDYLEKEKRNLNYSYLYKLSDYQGAHRYFTKQQDFEVTEGFLNELEGLDYNSVDDFEFSQDYKRLVTSNYRKEATDLSKKDSIENDIAFLKTVSSIDNEVIKNGLLFDHATFGITYTKDLDTYYNTYMANSTDDDNNAIITEKYNKLQALNAGKPSPQFVNYENYKGGKTSLSDLKGKYVYIDVWATWCAPCLGEIPSLKKVEKQFHDNNIEFVSISIDKLPDHEKWKTMIEEKELGGVQLFADNDWKSKFVTDYQIEGIPRFILIDPEGNIVDANAPRPSNSKLTELFTELSI